MAGKYSYRLTNKDILDLIKQRIYTVDLATGVILGQYGRPLKIVERASHPELEYSQTYQFVELYHRPSDKRRKIGVAAFVWMAGTKHAVPKGFIVHHQDLNTLNNAFDNLYCLHEIDHHKLHGGELIEIEDSDVPF